MNTHLSTPGWNAVRFAFVSSLLLTAVEVSVTKALSKTRGARALSGAALRLRPSALGRFGLHTDVDERSAWDRAAVRVLAVAALLLALCLEYGSESALLPVSARGPVARPWPPAPPRNASAPHPPAAFEFSAAPVAVTGRGLVAYPSENAARLAAKHARYSLARTPQSDGGNITLVPDAPAAPVEIKLHNYISCVRFTPAPDNWTLVTRTLGVCGVRARAAAAARAPPAGALAVRGGVLCAVRAGGGPRRMCVRVVGAPAWVAAAAAVEIAEAGMAREDFLLVAPRLGRFTLLYQSRVVAKGQRRALSETLARAMDRDAPPRRQTWRKMRERTAVDATGRGHNSVFPPETFKFAGGGAQLRSEPARPKFRRPQSQMLGAGRLWHSGIAALVVVFRHGAELCVWGALGEMCGERRRLQFIESDGRFCRLSLTDFPPPNGTMQLRTNVPRITWHSRARFCAPNGMLALYQTVLTSAGTGGAPDFAGLHYLIETAMQEQEITVGKAFVLGETVAGEYFVKDVERALVTMPFWLGVAGYFVLMLCSGLLWLKNRECIEVSISTMYRRKVAETPNGSVPTETPVNWPLVGFTQGLDDDKPHLTVDYDLRPPLSDDSSVESPSPAASHE